MCYLSHDSLQDADITLSTEDNSFLLVHNSTCHCYMLYIARITKIILYYNTSRHHVNSLGTVSSATEVTHNG